MELHQLRAYLAVRETGSATAAAARLGVRQSTVSAAVRTLERDLGVALFRRVGRGMQPTPAGHALVGPARRVLRDCGQLTELVATDDSHGRLQLAALSTVVEGPFSTLVARWLGAGAARTVRVRDLPREEAAVELLLNGTAEVVCTRLPLSVPGEESLRVVPLGSWGWQVAFPAGAAPGPEESIGMDDLAGVPMLLVPPGRQSSLERATARTPLDAAVIAEQREARTSMMLAGVGATIVGPGLAADVADAGADVRPLEPPFTQRVGLVYDEATLSPVGRSFVALAAETGTDETGESHEGLPRG